MPDQVDGAWLPAPVVVLKRLLPSALGHLRPLSLGGLFTLPAAGLHLALPLVVYAWIDVLAGPSDASTGAFRTPLGLSAAFIAILFGIGLAEHLQRLNFARFAIGWSRALRQRALTGVTSRFRPEGRSTGEVVSILIADVARFKAGVKVFLTYVVSNVLLLAGATVVLVLTDLTLGVIFMVTMFMTVLVAGAGAWGTYRGYLNFRDLEGVLAQAFVEGGGDDVRYVSATSSASEASEARINSRTTLAAHMLVGGAVLASLVAGAQGVAAGRLDPAAMLLFVGYVFLLTKPIVRLARHGARSGKLLACATRLVQLMEMGVLSERDAKWDAIAVDGLPSAQGGADISLHVPRGGRLLVVGSPGSGKSSLLRTMVGAPSRRFGSASIGEVKVRDVSRPRLERVVGLLEQEVTWRKQPLRKLLAATCDADSVSETLRAFGIDSIDDLPAGFDTRLESRSLSFDERRTFKLSELLASDRRILLLDDPPNTGDETLLARMTGDRERTWVIASGAPVEPSAFDQVLEFEQCRVAFLGPPAEWVASGRDVALWGVVEEW